MHTRRNRVQHHARSSNGRFPRFMGRNQPSDKANARLIQTIRTNQFTKPVSTDQEKRAQVHTSFADFPINDQLKKNLEYKKYSVPTPIQDETIDHIIEGRDIIGMANTGTGKTAAFLVPLIDKVSKKREEKVLIITPTRELALQINDEFYTFSNGLQIFSTLCIGGTSTHRQRNDLRRNTNFLIGTPGRIKDMVRSGSLNLSHFHSVVLDEADRMVDIGFINDIKYFISLLPEVRQSLFFSATIGGKEHEIIQKFVRDPVTVSVKQQETPLNIDQDLIKVVSKDKKVDQLHDLLIRKEFSKTLIFGRTKWGIQRLTNELLDRGFKADCIHGNRSQFQRQRAIERFKRNEISILLATDVASRGLDINNVSHVINYDLPVSYEDYVHRIGRTGRADNKGTALTFID